MIRFLTILLLLMLPSMPAFADEGKPKTPVIIGTDGEDSTSVTTYEKKRSIAAPIVRYTGLALMLSGLGYYAFADASGDPHAKSLVGYQKSATEAQRRKEMVALGLLGVGATAVVVSFSF